MANGTAPLESGGRRIPFYEDPAHGVEAYIGLVRGDVDMGGSNNKGGHATTLHPASTAARSNVTAATSNTQILAANEKRVGFAVKNDSTAILYLAYGSAAASLTSYTVDLLPGDYFEDPYNFAGEVRGIWSAVDGAARVTELVHA